MRTFRILALSAPLLFLSAGCDDAPAPGTVASPVDKEQAAKQNQAMKEFYKGKMGKTPAKYAKQADATP